MRVKMFKGADQVCRVAEKVLCEALSDPKIATVVETMLADETITKEQLYHTAFAQGVISTLAAIHDGHLIPLSSN